MTDILPRAFWDPQYQDGDIDLFGLAEEVFVHHTVSTQLSPSATVEQEIAEMLDLEQTGENRFGQGISYNVLVFPSGRAYQGVSWNRRGAHTDGRNSTTRSICFVGNYDVYQPTSAQLETARGIYHQGKGKLWQTDAPLYGHRDLKATACPGRFVYSRLDYMRTPPTPEGFLSMLNNTEQEELLTKVRQLHSSLYGLQVDMPWEENGKAVKYSFRSALGWVAARIFGK